MIATVTSCSEKSRKQFLLWRRRTTEKRPSKSVSRSTLGTTWKLTVVDYQKTIRYAVCPRHVHPCKIDLAIANLALDRRLSRPHLSAARIMRSAAEGHENRDDSRPHHERRQGHSHDMREHHITRDWKLCQIACCYPRSNGHSKITVTHGNKGHQHSSWK